MHVFWETVASNAVVATALAAGAMLMGRVWKNAAAVHVLWLVVLLKLFSPPLVIAGLPFTSPPHAAASRGVAVSPIPRQETAKSDPVAVTIPLASHAVDDPVVTPRDNLEEAGHGLWSLSAILGATWFCGACCVAVVYAASLRRFAGVIRDLDPTPPAIRMMVTELSSRLGLKRVPEVLMTPFALPPWSGRLGLPLA
jgi:beta-lactamase regulating signal transducer with metallopeptidase domain